MSDAVIVALVTAGMTGGVQIVGLLMSNRKTSFKIARLEEKFDDLKGKVEKHNNFMERVSCLEKGSENTNRRIDELREDMKSA